MSLKPQDKLRWLGLKRNTQKQSVIEEEINILRDNFNSFSDFQDLVSDQTAYEPPEEEEPADGESFLTNALQNNGFSETQALKFASKCRSNFPADDTENGDTSFENFSQHTQNSNGWADWKAEFKKNANFSSELLTEDGASAAGVEVYDAQGTTRDGVEVPPGTIEMYGYQVHFSKTGEYRTGSGTGTVDESGADEQQDDGPSFTVENIRTVSGDTVVYKGQEVTIAVDVVSQSDYPEYVSLGLYEDGDLVDTVMLGGMNTGSSDDLNETDSKLQPGETRTIKYKVVKEDVGCHEYDLADTDPITICWDPFVVGQTGIVQ